MKEQDPKKSEYALRTIGDAFNKIISMDEGDHEWYMAAASACAGGFVMVYEDLLKVGQDVEHIMHAGNKQFTITLRRNT